MESIKKVSFGTSMIQRNRRVALDPNLLTTLGLQEGDTVQIELDVGTATILIRKDVLRVVAKGNVGLRRSRGK